MEPEGVVFPYGQQQPKYSLTDGKWFAMFFAGNVGVYSGHWFYINFIMGKNPPHVNEQKERRKK